MTVDLNLFIRQQTRLADAFREFRAARMVWDDILRRRMKIVGYPELKDYMEGVDIQSPDAEYALQTHVSILKLNPTKVDAESMDTRSQALDDVEDVRIWLSSWWANRLNLNRRLDSGMAESLCRYGVSVLRLYWQMPDEPDTPEEEAKETAESADRWVRGREAHYRELADETFRVDVVNPLSLSWWPLENPNLVFEDALIPYTEAVDIQNEAGEWLSLDAAGKVVFLGERQPWEFGSAANSQSGSTMPAIHLVTRAQKDRVTGKWTICEVVYPDGKAAGTYGSQVAELEVPMDRCPYFVIPASGERRLETNPNLRFRPMMYRLYVYLAEYNETASTLAALARKYSSDFHVFVNISRLSPELASRMEEFCEVEGQGDQRRLVFRMPRPGTGEIVGAPSIEKWPTDLNEAFVLRLKDLKELIADTMPNRFMDGSASFGSAREIRTGTEVVNMLQQARIPYSDMLSCEDAGIKEVLAAMCEIVRWWDEDVPEGAGKSYYARVTAALPLMRAAKKDTGELVFVNAQKLSRPFELNVKTKNQTQAEEAQAALMAYQDKGQGVITQEQLIERRGNDDPQKQLELLERYEQEKALEPYKRALINQSNVALWSAQTGAMVASVMGLRLPQPPPPPTGGQGAQPFEQVPNREPGGAPQWRPGAMASEMPPMEGPAPGLGVHPAITAAPIMGPEGGSSGQVGR